MIPKNVQNIGLTEKELSLYEILLGKGEVPASALIKKSGFKRPTVYKSLYSLEEKGLVEQRKFKKKIHFRAKEPTKLLDLADSEYKKLEQAKMDLKDILPQLNSTYQLSTEKPIVTVHEGLKGVKEVFEDTLNVGEEIYAVVQNVNVDDRFFINWLRDKYVPKRAKLGIHSKVIETRSDLDYKYLGFDEKLNRTSVIVPKRLFSFRQEIMIYGTKIAFVNYRKDAPMIGVVINQSDMVESMRAWFELAWVGAMSMQKDV